MNIIKKLYRKIKMDYACKSVQENLLRRVNRIISTHNAWNYDEYPPALRALDSFEDNIFFNGDDYRYNCWFGYDKHGKCYYNCNLFLNGRESHIAKWIELKKDIEEMC